MILFVPSATRKKHKIITQALVIIKPVIETKQQEENLKLVFSRMGVVSAMNGVYYECGFEASITASSTQTKEACCGEQNRPIYSIGTQRDRVGSNHHG